MRKIIVGAFVSLDGIMQAPGGPHEDPVGCFDHGGWAAPYFDETMNKRWDRDVFQAVRSSAWSKTYDIFAATGPYAGPDDPIGPLFDRSPNMSLRATPI